MKIKKKIATIFSVVLTVCSVSNSFAGIGIKVNNQPLKGEAQSQIVNGRTLVPVRTIFEALGANVDWDSDTKTIKAKKDNISVVMVISQNYITVNGKTVDMDASAMIMGGRTYAPARYVAEAFGYNVEWDSKSKTVLINKTINQVTTEKSTETTTVVTTKAETTTKKTEVTTKKTKVPNKVETTTKKVEKSTETTTMSAQDILNSSPIEGVGATVFKLVKNDIKNAFKLYHIGNANSNNRFSQSTYNKFMEMWKSAAKTDVEKQFVSQSQIVYKSMITTCKKLDKRVEKHPASADVRNYCEKRRETLENMISTYLASKDIAAVKSNAEKIKKYATATSST